MTAESPRWFKSSYSNNGGACIELAANLLITHGVVPVRDSKRPNGPVLDVHARAFADFVGGVKGGDFGNTASPSWFTSSYSDNGGQCIEVAANLVAAHGIVPVRDSKRPDGPVVHVRADAFSCFVNGLKGAS